MKKIIINAAYTLWGAIVLFLSSILYVPADFRHFDVIMLGCVVVALAVHLRLNDYKGTFPFRYCVLYTGFLLVLGNIFYLLCFGLIYMGHLIG